MKHLLQLFNELSLHPKNAKALKGLILQLAIQGKLTENWRKENPDVESADFLLNKIYKTKKELVEKKLIKNSKKLPLPKNDELYFDIPKTWAWERIGNIGEIFNGNSVNKNLKASKYEGLDEGYPYIATKDVGYIFEKIHEDNGVKIPFDESKFKIAKKKTVLICAEGGSAGKKMGITTQDCCFGNKLYALEQYYGIDSIYVLCLYGSSSFSEAFRKNMNGIIGGISRSKFIELLIPIPPLQEQKAIVSIVEELFAEVEQLEQKTVDRIQFKKDYATSALQNLAQADDVVKAWQDIQPHFKTFFNEKANIKQLRETILQLAVQGKLTDNWRKERQLSGAEIEPASELLKRIKAEKQKLISEKKIKKEKPLSKISEDEKPFKLPYGWEWCRLVEVGLINPRNSTNDLLEIGFVPMKMINKSYRAKPRYEKRLWKDVKKSFTHFKNQDVAIAKITPCFENGKACVFEGLPNDYGAGTTELHVFRKVTDDIYSNFIYSILKSSDFIKKGEDKMTGSAGQKRVPKNYFSNYIIGLPPLEEQKAIVNIVDALMAECDALERNIEQRDTLLEDLMASCLQEMENKKTIDQAEELRMVAESGEKYLK